MRPQAVKRKRITADNYSLPPTMWEPSRELRTALDACFQPVRGLLNHAFEGLANEGLPMFVGYPTLAGLAQNGLVRAGVEMRADEMTRKWGNFVRDSEGEGNEKLARLEELGTAYKLKELFNRASAMCGYFGGCLVFIDAGTDDLANPLILDAATFERGDFKGLKLVEPFAVTPGVYNSVNPLASDYFKPPLWYVQGVPVHATRFLYFAENELPSLLKPAYNFFGMSLSQKVLDAVSHYTDCRESANRLLKKCSTTVFKTDMENVLTGGFDTALQTRVDYFVQNRDNDGVATIDKEREDLIVVGTNLGGVTDIVRQAMEYVAAMFNEPVTKMWGLSPAGFNTGDADLRNHYDNIASLQAKMFETPMKRLCELLQMNEWGEIDESIFFKFAPLSEDDESLKANTNKVQADTDAVLIGAGVISPDEARQRLIEDEDSGYNSLTPYAEPEPFNEGLEPFNENEEP